jgi:hypothetical protein
MSILFWVLAVLGALAALYVVFTISMVLGLFRALHEIDKDAGWEELSE